MATSGFIPLAGASLPSAPPSKLGELMASGGPVGAEPDAGGTLAFLLRRMRLKSDFPTLSDSVLRIQRVASSENQSVSDLTHEILKNVALTHKLLRLVNSVHYARPGQGSISTVSRAVTLVGFNAVRNMALSLVLLDRMPDKAHAGRMMEEFARTMMAGSIAGELCAQPQDAEEAFIGAVFQNLGRMLTEFYFQEEAQEIRALVAESRFADGEDAASVKVLGLSYEQLGLGVAKVWGLPDTLRRCMRRPLGAPPARPPELGAERLRWITMAANDVASVLLLHEPEMAAVPLQQVAEHYAQVLALRPDVGLKMITRGREKFVRMVEALELAIAPDSMAARLLFLPEAAPSAAPEDALAPHALSTEPVSVAAADPVRPDPERRSTVLVAGLQEVAQVMVEGFALNDTLRMILETMFRALDLRRVVFCLREAKADMLTGRFGLGEDSEQAVRAFQIPLKSSSDLFAVVCNRGADTLIADATEPRIAARLPAWYKAGLNAPTFLLLPLQMRGGPFALIYADRARPGSIVLGDKELSLLRTLRDQALMAFRQST